MDKAPTFPVLRDGIHIVFFCPVCGKENRHGAADLPPGSDHGHRSSHCDCWPLGYHLQEVDVPAHIANSTRKMARRFSRTVSHRNVANIWE
jgi:hypothetical protein